MEPENIMYYKNVCFRVSEKIKEVAVERRVFEDAFEFEIPSESISILIYDIEHDFDMDNFFDEEERQEYQYIGDIKAVKLGMLESRSVIFANHEDSFAEFRALLPGEGILCVGISAQKRQDIRQILQWAEIKEMLNSFTFRG